MRIELVESAFHPRGYHSMLLGEPPATAADLNFRLFGFPIRIHPFFWVVALLLGLGADSADPVETFVWVAVVFVSILIHELGHAFVQRYYGGRPWITLYSLGGLASCTDCDRSPRAQIIISLAGPFAGFMFAGLIIAGVRLAGHAIWIVLLGGQLALLPGGVLWDWAGRFVLFRVGFDDFTSPLVNTAIFQLLYVNILWGLVNLLPVYPLDGGRVARELFTLGNPRQGIVQSLQLSIGAAVLVAVYALIQERLFLGIMFGILAYESYQALQAYQNHWR